MPCFAILIRTKSTCDPLYRIPAPPGDDTLCAYAAKHFLPCVELGDLGEDDRMKEIVLFAHDGVANHHGDLGMQKIAERISACPLPIIEQYKKTDPRASRFTAYADIKQWAVSNAFPHLRQPACFHEKSVFSDKRAIPRPFTVQYSFAAAREDNRTCF